MMRLLKRCILTTCRLEGLVLWSLSLSKLGGISASSAEASTASTSAECTPLALFCLALMSFSSYGNISDRVNRLGDVVRKHRPGALYVEEMLEVRRHMMQLHSLDLFYALK